MKNPALRRTKIVATLGPASDTEEIIEDLLNAGVNLFRLNLSHGTVAEHTKTLRMIRETAGRLNLSVGVIADLQGPKIRTGLLNYKSIELTAGARLTITTEDMRGDASRFSTTYKGLAKDVTKGDRILIDDGMIELQVLNVKGEEVHCEVLYGGTLSEHKGMNLPGVEVSASALSDKDLLDLDFAVGAGVDYIAISFVQKAADITDLKERIRLKGAFVPVIAKIETMKAVEDIDAIIETCDAVMVARGDLGVELSPEKVPVLQKKIISLANEAGKPVITATQMLESMIKNPRPTRAEASDVANAVFDNTDAVMLSGETAVGLYPVKSVETMVQVIMEAEGEAINKRRFIRRNMKRDSTYAEAVSFAAFAAAGEVNARAICVFTESGLTALNLARLRPITPVVAFTPIPETLQRLTLVWGIRPYLLDLGDNTDDMICRGEAALINLSLAQKEDAVVIISGTKVGMKGATNMMKIDRIGNEKNQDCLK